MRPINAVAWRRASGGALLGSSKGGRDGSEGQSRRRRVPTVNQSNVGLKQARELPKRVRVLHKHTGASPGARAIQLHSTTRTQTCSRLTQIGKTSILVFFFCFFFAMTASFFLQPCSPGSNFSYFCPPFVTPTHFQPCPSDKPILLPLSNFELFIILKLSSGFLVLQTRSLHTSNYRICARMSLWAEKVAQSAN